MALLNVEGTGMVGIPGVANKLFGALRAVDVSVTLISQASSEHSICFAVPQAQAELAKKIVEDAFLAEMQRGQVQTVNVTSGCCILAMVGEGMFKDSRRQILQDSCLAEMQRGQVQTVNVTSGCCILAMVGDGMIKHSGMAGRFFTALGKADVNVRAIAQGSSERNISAVIEQRDATKALRAVHSAFYLSSQTLSIGVIGTGLIGGAFLSQLQPRVEPLKTERGIDLRVRGVMNSRKMLLHDRQLRMEGWKQDLCESAVSSDLDRFVEHVHA